jgi:hypothetical protein
MKYFSILTPVLTMALIISACGARGAQATPTISAVEIQSTAAVLAFTIVAETQAALPTATPPPPTATITNTPVPTETFLPLPSPLTLTPAANGNSGGVDPCVDKVLPATLQGEPVKIRINNSTKAQISFSIYLNQTTPQSECGYRTYTIAPEQSLNLNNLVEGCFTLWAWNPDPKEYFIVTNGTNCLDNSATWVFDISNRTIELKT